MFNGKSHYKWPFSIAMLVYQRVNIVILCHITEYDYMMYEQTVV